MVSAKHHCRLPVHKWHGSRTRWHVVNHVVRATVSGALTIGRDQITIAAMSERERLLKEIEEFIARHDIPASIFGREAVNDTALVGRLRAWGDVQTKTVDRVRKFMRDYKPKKRKPRRRLAEVRAA